MHARHPRLSRSLIASASALGLVLGISPAAGASTAGHPAVTRASVAARAAAAARSAIEHMHIGQHATAHLVPGHAVRGDATTQLPSDFAPPPSLSYWHSPTSELSGHCLTKAANSSTASLF